MKIVSLETGIHNFSKVNLVAISDRGRIYDILKCKDCGLEGKRFGFSPNIQVPESTSDKKIENCIHSPSLKKSAPDKYIGKKIKVIQCNTQGSPFKNLTPGSIHPIITPPEGYLNGDRGVWVQGIGEPVKILWVECDVLEEKPKFIRTKW